MNIINLVTSSTFETNGVVGGGSSSSSGTTTVVSGAGSGSQGANNSVIDSSLATTPNSADAPSKAGSDDAAKEKWDYSIG